MYFKALEMVGFKSFADRTELEFRPGITAIVGPNGCGKSNIVDAIRWALGEQNARLLRSIRMEDVIFNGSSSRKPLGMAEVSLTITNPDRVLPIDYGEVTIARRLFRSGQSEYYINKAPCRLKDVVELFMGTGIGISSYSLIEQGKLELILSAKPLERRFLFEEAAGITKYKGRKEEAVRKLEATQQNLLRLGDVIQEVKRQINSLSRQVKLAQRYSQYRDELQELDGSLSMDEIRTLQKEKETLAAQAQKLEEKGKRIAAALQKKEERLSGLKLKFDSSAKGLMDTHQTILKIESDIERCRDRIGIHQERKAAIIAGAERRDEEIKGLASKRSALKGEIAQREAQLVSLTTQISQVSRDLGERESYLETVSGRLKEEKTQIDSSKAELVSILNRISQHNNDLKHLQASQRNLDVKRETLALDRSRINEEVRECQQRSKDAEYRITLWQGKIEDLKSELASLSKEREDCQSRMDWLREEIYKLNSQIAKETSRLDFIEELQREFKGFTEGVKEVLLAKRSRPADFRGLCGAVANLIKTSSQYERPIEVALSDRLQNVVTETVQDARAAITHLKSEGRGRAAFLPLDLIRPPSSSGLPDEVAKLDGVIGLASDLVEFEPKYDKVKNFLLGQTLVARDLSVAARVAKKTNGRFCVVTLDGDMIEPSGAISGGSYPKETIHILGRERQIQELSGKLASLKAQLRGHQEKARELKVMMEGFESQINALDSDIRRHEKSLFSEEGKLERLASGLERLNKERESLADDGEDLIRQEGDLKVAQDELAKSLSQLDRERQKLEADIARLAKRVDQREDEYSQRTAQVTALKVLLASLRERGEASREAIKRLQENMADVVESVEIRTQENDQSRSRAEELANLGDRESERVEGFIRKKSEAEESLKVLESGRQNLEGELSRENEELKEILSQQGKVHDQLNEIGLKESKLAMAMENIVRRLKADYGLSLEDASEKYPPEGMGDRKEIRQRIAELREKMARMGLVNLLAIEESKGLQARYDFLTGQKADLEEARHSLYELIDKIERQATKRFLDTFEKIQRNFDRVFKELFGGGRAELVLLDKANPLEFGIDIKARPPGRRLQSISLLSGGEKALTAIALLFGIFMVKPSPFCILDEIDVALDEANIERFTKVLANFAKQSQFIIITHNNGTIEASDTMYGVTMEESGVSKIVSVRFAREAVRGGERG